MEKSVKMLAVQLAPRRAGQKDSWKGMQKEACWVLQTVPLKADGMAPRKDDR